MTCIIFPVSGKAYGGDTMHAHQRILKLTLDCIHTNQHMLRLATAAASAASFRLELTEQQNKLDRMESELLQIAGSRGWELKPALHICFRKRFRRVTDSQIAETMIRQYSDTLMIALRLLHSLPYPDGLTETAVDRIRDSLVGCMMSLLSYL